MFSEQYLISNVSSIYGEVEAAGHQLRINKILEIKDKVLNN